MLTAISAHIKKNDMPSNHQNDDQVPAYLKFYESTLAPPKIIPQPDITNIFEYLYQTPLPDATELPLSDISDKDAIWSTQRHKTELVGDIYGYNPEFERYHERMCECSTFLAYGFSNDILKLKRANFCRVRHCPVCQWRRSLLWKSNMYIAYAEIKAKYPTHRWLFLTLTIKNPPITELRDELNHMNESWRRLIKRKEFLKVVEGWIRTTEVTKGKDNPNNAHPHFHVMLLVKPSYFTHGYIKQARWAELWGEVLRVDYFPMVNVKTVKARKKSQLTDDDVIKGAIMETLKYSVKPDDMIGKGTKKDNEWFYELTRQTFKLRFIASGGALKNVLKRDESITDEDLVNVSDNDDAVDSDERRLVFSYYPSKHCYLYNPSLNY